MIKKNLTAVKQEKEKKTFWMPVLNNINTFFLRFFNFILF